METSNNSNIKEIYLYNLKKDIKNKLKEKEYIVNSIDVSIQSGDDYKIKEIILDLEKNKTTANIDIDKEENVVNRIEQVNIQIGEKQETDKSKVRKLNNKEKTEVKEYLSSTYDINTRKITIN